MAEINNPEIDGSVAAEVKIPQPTPATAVPRKAQQRDGYWWGTGRRKSSVARVRIRPGEGKFVVNKRELTDYFPREQDRRRIMSPLATVEAEKAFDVFVNVKGGGSTGQSGAVSLGIARALKNSDESYAQALRDGDHLTRDSRMVERKKPGQKGARKKFQFSKR